ncbi:hypothetical protein TNCV_2428571 [Trichonephila clavipes]|nr:hypothetical protein TNCV_2428571 [Trichonephila clavipes]
MSKIFGLGAFDKIKIPSTVSHRQSSGVSLWKENKASKLLVMIGIPPIWCHTKKRCQLLGSVLDPMFYQISSDCWLHDILGCQLLCGTTDLGRLPGWKGRDKKNQLFPESQRI